MLLFLKRHNIKLINGRPRNPWTQGLVEQANSVVKDKIAKWQAVNGTGDWADSLTEICDAINNQTQESLPAGVTPMQLMFARKPESFTSHATEEERCVLRHVSVEDIDSFCEETEQGKGKGRKPESHCRVEDALEIIPIEAGFEREDPDPENPLQFKYVKYPCLLSLIN